MRILFLTSRNIYNTNGELRLIKNRANVLYEEFGIISDFICYHDDEIFSDSQEVINTAFDFSVITYSQNKPYTLFVNRKKLKKKVVELLNQKHYDAVIISGQFAFQFISFIRGNTKVPVICDIHGASDELIEFSSGDFFSNIKRRIIFSLFRHYEKKYIKQYDAAFVVTVELKENVIRTLAADNLHFFIVPCAKKYDDFDRDQYIRFRTHYRKQYGISDKERLFIYSGGISPWQCIDKTVDLFNRISDRIPDCKFLILSDQADKLSLEQENIIIDKLPFDKVDETLCAGDYAFMIRDDLVTNQVAFPNKYCEYVASGMRIISSPYLRTVSKSIKENDLGYVLRDNNDVEGVIEYVMNDKLTQDFDKRYKVLKSFEFEHTLIPFVKYLKGETFE